MTNATNNDTNELTVQHWAHCAPFLDALHYLFTLSHWLKGLALSFHLTHGHSHAHWCLSVLPPVFLLPAQVHLPPLPAFCHGAQWLHEQPPVPLRNGSMVKFDCCTPTQVMSPTSRSSAPMKLNNATSGDICFQDSLEDTVSLSNPDIDDDELGKLLAIVVDRTGQRVLGRRR